jgi:hypothetical protein
MRPSKLLVQKLEEEREMGQKRMPKEKKSPNQLFNTRKIMCQCYCTLYK